MTNDYTANYSLTLIKPLEPEPNEGTITSFIFSILTQTIIYISDGMNFAVHGDWLFQPENWNIRFNI